MPDRHQRDIDWERLDRYIRRVAPPEEQAALEAWVRSDPELAALAAAMRTIGRAHETSDHRPDAARALTSVRRRLGLSQPIHPAPALALTTVSRARRHRWPTVVVFAGLAASTVISVWLSGRTPPGAASPPIDSVRVVETRSGQRAHIELTDGTRVALSAASRLTFRQRFGTGAAEPREVSLAGEALFSVAHDSLRPFLVRTEFGTAEDMGTEFVVSTYPETHGMQLAVRAGRVAIRVPAAVAGTPPAAGQDSAIAYLSAGDVARVRPTGDLAVSRHRDVAPFFAGADGSLVLRSVALQDAIPMLERWFGITIRLNDRGVLGRKVSGTFRDESARAAIGVIAVALGQTVKWNGNQVILASRDESGER